MKKILIVAIIFTVLFSVVCLASCGNAARYTGEIYDIKGVYDRGWLSRDDLIEIADKYANEECPAKEMPNLIKNDILSTLRYEFNQMVEKYGFKDLEVPDYEITAYYGKYGDMYFFSYGSFEVEAADGTETRRNQVNIDGVEFVFFGETDIKVFVKKEDVAEYQPEKSGEFYTLQEAYAEGLLSDEDIENVSYYHHYGFGEEFVANTDYVDKDFSPVPLSPETLHYGTELKIRSTIAREYRESGNKDETYTQADPEDFTISEYGGTYGGCAVVMIANVNEGYLDAILEETVGGKTFYYSSYNTLKVWKAYD